MKQPQIVKSALNAAFGNGYGGPEKPHIVEAAGQSYKDGDLLYLDSSKNVAIATVDGSNYLNTPIAGIANRGYVGSGLNVYFERIRHDHLIEMSIYHATPASAELTLAMLTQICAIKKISNIWVCDVETAIGTLEAAAASLAKVRIVDIVDDIGDRYARVLVQFLRFSIETDGGGLVRNLQLDC